ncbi:MAG: alpha/beta fold hydrolase [Burkholderiaceae bacterium]
MSISSVTDDHYQSPPWLAGSHWQTIYAAQFAPRPPIIYRRERWLTTDSDFIDVDFTTGDISDTAPILVLFHGLEGCSLSHYAVALMAAAQARGWRGAVAHFRGCSGEINLAPRAYHSGDSDEIDFVLRRIAQQFPGSLRFAAGVSLGGNALLKWAGIHGTGASKCVERIASISAPHDLHAGAAALSRGFSQFYTWIFLRTLKAKSHQKLAQYPGLFSREKMEQSRNFFDFDDAVTAPIHGFSSCYDYWTRSSSGRFLPQITVPALVLNALNDPFVPTSSLSLPSQVSASVQLEYPPSGGHVGFVSGSPPGSLNWLIQRLFTWFGEAANG